MAEVPQLDFTNLDFVAAMQYSDINAPEDRYRTGSIVLVSQYSVWRLRFLVLVRYFLSRRQHRTRVGRWTSGDQPSSAMMLKIKSVLRYGQISGTL